jgi:hypothetical protein
MDEEVLPYQKAEPEKQETPEVPKGTLFEFTPAQGNGRKSNESEDTAEFGEWTVAGIGDK